MGLNHSEVFETIERLVASDRTVGECMVEVIGICSRDLPHPGWSQLAQINFDEDVAALSAWIPGVFERQPAPFPIQGLWFGLCQRRNERGQVWADMHVVAMSHYDPDDTEFGWLWKEPRHYPDNAHACSLSLCKIYVESYKSTTGLGNDAEWPLALAFGAFAVRSLLRGQTVQLVGSPAPRVGVVVGFDDGDLVKVGELTTSGFEPAACAGS
jgi:hypothetical protein